jgi:hypothetical protein
VDHTIEMDGKQDGPRQKQARQAGPEQRQAGTVQKQDVR